jgi:serine/threonine-protein kinase
LIADHDVVIRGDGAPACLRSGVVSNGPFTYCREKAISPAHLSRIKSNPYERDGQFRFAAISSYSNLSQLAELGTNAAVNQTKFFIEAKRRNVYKVAIAYIVAGWALSQGIAQVFPVFDVPNWVIRLIVLLIIVGLPIALVLAWMFELTPQGIKRTEIADAMPGVAGKKKRGWIYLVIVAGALSIGLFFLGRYTAPNMANLPAKSIAVLPFDNQNRDPDTDYLSDGIPESIINSLSQLPNLKVMSRNSVFHYKGKDTDARAVAKELNVQSILTGRVTQRGDGLSVSVELINAQDNSQIWGQQYNRKLADVFAVQEEIATEISEKLRSKLSGAERQQLAQRPTENLKAFQYYMQGRSYTQRRTREDLLQAISYCEKATNEDGNYALAYAGLADAYAALGVRGYIAPQEARQKTEEAARKALALNEKLAEAHAALGYVDTAFAPYSFSLGDRELRRAIELSPSSALAHFYLGLSLVRQGRLDEGLEELLKARELDPLLSSIARSLALPYYLKRDYTRALELLRQANQFGPGFSTTFEIGIYIQNRLLDEPLAELEKAKGERKGDPILIYSTGMVYAAQGKRAEALQIIKALEEMSGASMSEAHWIAKIYSALNEKEQALTWLERGLATGAIGAFYKDEPVWDPIRIDPRFADLLRRMGIPQ